MPIRETTDPRRELKARLAIEREALDDCLIEQPGLYSSVAQYYASAVAERDAAKLMLEEATAVLDKQVRLSAAEEDEKITNDAVASRIKVMPKIKELTRLYADKRHDAEQWLALKEAYQQRSFMLRELVALHLAQLHNLSLERGSARDRKNLGEGYVEHRRRENSR